MKLVLLQGILALTFCLASTADVKRQLGFSDVGSYHTFFDAHPTPFIAIARADNQGPALTSVGISKSASPLQGITATPLHDFNLQAVPHAVLLTPVAAKGVALDQGWHGFETAPLTFSPSFSHKALVPVHDSPYELTPVLQNYPIQKSVPLTNFGQNYVANSFNKHLNAPPSHFSTFNGDIKQYHGFQAPSGFSGVIQHDSKQQVTQPVKSISQAAPPSANGLISSPAPILSSPAYDSTQSTEHLGGHSSVGQESGFQGSHHFSPSAADSPTHGSKSSTHSHGRGHHYSPKHHEHSGYKQHSLISTSFGASASGGSSLNSHSPSSTHHTAPSGLGHSSITHSSHGHGTKAYTHGYTSGHSNTESTGSYHTSHRPSSSQSGFGSTGYGSSSTSHTDSEPSTHGSTNDHGEKATSFQSFVIHSYKPVPVYSKKSEYRHFEPQSSKHHYHSPYYGNSNEHYDRSY